MPLNELDPVWWNRFVSMITPMVEINGKEMRETCEPAIPTYYLRYEDLVLNPQPVLMELFCFMLEVPDIKGTVIEQRVIDYCAKGTDTGAVYKLKVNPASNLSRNAHMFTPEQIEMFKENCRDYLYYYGYVDHPDNDTAFFNYSDGGRV